MEKIFLSDLQIKNLRLENSHVKPSALLREGLVAGVGNPHDMSHKKKVGCLGKKGDGILPSYMGMIS